MQLPDDYYQILDVSKDANSEEIRQAFRRLAKQYHPDINKTAGSEDLFKKINEAYQILSDPLKKEKYDFIYRYVKVSQTKSGVSSQTNTGAQAKSEPQPKSKSNSYAYTNTKSTNSYSYDPWKSQAKQSTNSQQRESSDSGSSYRYSDGWGQYYTSPEANTVPEAKRKISAGIIIFAVVVLYFVIKSVSNDLSNPPANSYPSSSYSSSNNYFQPTTTPNPTQTKKPDAIADGLDVTFDKFQQKFNNIYATKLPIGISNYGLDYSKAYVNENSELYFAKNLKGSIHTVVLYLSFNANNDEELDNIGMAVVSLVQAAIPYHVFTKAEQNDVFDQIIENGKVYKYGKVIISIEAWDQTGKKDKVWIVARKMNEYGQYGVFDLQKSTDGYSVVTLLFNGQSQIYGREFSGFYLASNGKYFKNGAHQQATHVPLKTKTGGYTEKELVSAGYVGKESYDGTMFYEGFYIAPNGNYYPVGKNIPTVDTEERTRVEEEYWESFSP